MSRNKIETQQQSQNNVSLHYFSYMIRPFCHQLDTRLSVTIQETHSFPIHTCFSPTFQVEIPAFWQCFILPDKVKKWPCLSRTPSCVYPRVSRTCWKDLPGRCWGLSRQTYTRSLLSTSKTWSGRETVGNLIYVVSEICSILWECHSFHARWCLILNPVSKLVISTQCYINVHMHRPTLVC